MAENTETVHQHLHEVHEHLRHESTSDTPEQIRERLRREELAQQREVKDAPTQTQTSNAA